MPRAKQEGLRIVHLGRSRRQKAESPKSIRQKDTSINREMENTALNNVYYSELLAEQNRLTEGYAYLEGKIRSQPAQDVDSEFHRELVSEVVDFMSRAFNTFDQEYRLIYMEGAADLIIKLSRLYKDGRTFPDALRNCREVLEKSGFDLTPPVKKTKTVAPVQPKNPRPQVYHDQVLNIFGLPDREKKATRFSR